MASKDTPPPTPKKKEGDNSPAAPTTSKRPAAIAFGPASKKTNEAKKGKADNTSQEERSGSVGGVDTGGTGYISRLINVCGQSNGGAYHYKKRFRLSSFAYSKSLIRDGTGSTSRAYMSTSMAAIPTDFPLLYFTRAEWLALPRNSRIGKATIKLNCLNARPSFQANATDVTTATLNNQLFLNMKIGGERDGDVIIVKNESNVTQPMLVTGFTSVTQDDYDSIETMLYGPTNVTTMTEIPCILGKQRVWPLYCALNVQPTNIHSLASVDSNSGVWLGAADYEIVTALNNQNTHMYTWDNDFKGAPARGTWPFKIPQPKIASTTGYNVAIWNKDKQSHSGARQINSAGSLIGNADPETLVLWGNADTAIENSYYHSMHKPRLMNLKPGELHVDEFPVPWIYFGIEELPAQTPNAPDQYLDAQLFWEIETSIHVTFTHNQHTTQGTPSTAWGDTIWRTINATDSQADSYVDLAQRSNGFILGRPYDAIPTPPSA